MATDSNNKGMTRKSYGDLYSQHYFEQYKIYLEGIEKISDRRESANKYYLALNSGVILAAGFLIERAKDTELLLVSLVGIALLGLMISIIFFYLLSSYRQLNTGKFQVLHDIEKKLPILLYSEEWKVLGEGKDYKKYYPFSHIEKLIPVLFGAVYLLGVLILTILLCNTPS